MVSKHESLQSFECGINFCWFFDVIVIVWECIIIELVQYGKTNVAILLDHEGIHEDFIDFIYFTDTEFYVLRFGVVGIVQMLIVRWRVRKSLIPQF